MYTHLLPHLFNQLCIKSPSNPCSWSRGLGSSGENHPTLWISVIITLIIYNISVRQHQILTFLFEAIRHEIFELPVSLYKYLPSHYSPSLICRTKWITISLVLSKHTPLCSGFQNLLPPAGLSSISLCFSLFSLVFPLHWLLSWSGYLCFNRLSPLYLPQSFTHLPFSPQLIICYPNKATEAALVKPISNLFQWTLHTELLLFELLTIHYCFLLLNALPLGFYSKIFCSHSCYFCLNLSHISKVGVSLESTWCCFSHSTFLTSWSHLLPWF